MKSLCEERFERRPEAEAWVQEETRCDSRRENAAGEVWPWGGDVSRLAFQPSLGRCGELIRRSQEMGNVQYR